MAYPSNAFQSATASTKDLEGESPVGIRWYAAYTTANHEKSVANQLSLRAMEHFLPLYESARRWKDRRVTLQLPLFPGYVFVRMTLRNRLQVLQTPGVANLVEFDGSPAPLPDEEIEALRSTLRKGVKAEPHPYLTVGRRVKLKSGTFVGLQGILKRRKGQSRLIVSVELIHRAVAIEIEETAVGPVESLE